MRKLIDKHVSNKNLP